MNTEAKMKKLFKEMLYKFTESSISKPDSYNLFSVLGVEYLEVRHCNFIADLLNYKGRHGQGAVFYNLFYETLLEKHFDKNIANAPEIVTEFAIENGKRIDILMIYKNGYLLPIEMKINHIDSDNQIRDYYEFCDAKGNRDSLQKILY